jgi:hypothetical protein
MHPTIAHDLARSRIADFHAQADADRRVLAARREDESPGAGRFAPLHGSRWGQRPDPTGLVRRLMARLHPVVAP